MPEFTFIRTVSSTYTNYAEFPMAAEVSMEIMDEEGHIVLPHKRYEPTLNNCSSEQIAMGAGTNKIHLIYIIT